MDCFACQSASSADGELPDGKVLQIVTNPEKDGKESGLK
jgi:hypothetical protein